MADYQPFRGLRYDPTVAGAMDHLICPPYDVISPSAEAELLARSPHNMVRLELAEIEGPPPAERYSAAAKAFTEWQQQGVLRRDEEAAYYLLRQRFPFGGGLFERYGLLGALRLEELGTGVLPHEHTAPGPKEDRLALMQACEANFSPLMALYRDEGRQVESVRNRAMARPPETDLRTDDGGGVTLWRVSDERDCAVVRNLLATRPVYIADGHHRYETALTYRNQIDKGRDQIDKGGQADPSGAHNYALMCLIDFDDPGLLILPYHRVVHGLSQEQLRQVRRRLSELFVMQPAGIDAGAPGPLEALVAQEGVGRPVLGLVGAGGDGPYLLSLAEPAMPLLAQPQGPEEAVRQIEAWLLQEEVLRPVLGDGFADHVAYMHDGAEALKMVRDGQGQLAFFLKGVPADLFEVVVGAGIRLPRKSTYFWPKLPSGLVINLLSSPL